MSTKELMKDGTIGIADAQAFSGLGRTFLYAAMTNGELAYVKCGSRRLIPKQALMKFLEDRLKGSDATGNTNAAESSPGTPRRRG